MNTSVILDTLLIILCFTLACTFALAPVWHARRMRRAARLRLRSLARWQDRPVTRTRL